MELSLIFHLSFILESDATATSSKMHQPSPSHQTARRSIAKTHMRTLIRDQRIYGYVVKVQVGFEFENEKFNPPSFTFFDDYSTICMINDLLGQ